MAKLGVRREVLARMLRSHSEDDLAERALSLSDDELARIGTLGGYYAFSEDAMALGGSMGTTRALSLATIDVLEGTGLTCAVTTASARWRGECQWSRTRVSVPRIESSDVMPLSNRYLLMRASEFLKFLILRRGGLHHRMPRL